MNRNQIRTIYCFTDEEYIYLSASSKENGVGINVIVSALLRSYANELKTPPPKTQHPNRINVYLYEEDKKLIEEKAQELHAKEIELVRQLIELHRKENRIDELKDNIKDLKKTKSEIASIRVLKQQERIRKEQNNE